MGRQEFALLRDDKQVINEVAQMHEGWTGRLLFELFPAGETGATLDHEERVQYGSRLLRDGLKDPSVQAARCNGSNMMGRFVQRSKGREFKVFPGEFLQSDINQVGQILFGSGCLHHRFEQAGACGRTIGLEPLGGSYQGNMSLPCSTAIVIV